jgi:hypothetical protein
MCCPPLFQNEINIGDIMKARILLMVTFLILPNFLLAQNLSTQQFPSFSLHQKKIKSFFDNNSDMNLIESVNSFKLQSDSLRSYCDNGTRSLFVLRLAGFDHEDCINFYGISMRLIHYNNEATFSGLALSLDLGDPSIPASNISVNGINIGVLNTTTIGTINGISISGISDFASKLNGLEVALWGIGTDYLNGLTIGGFASYSININGIKISFINISCRLNGLGIGFINAQVNFLNAQSEESCNNNFMISNGVALGVFNILDIHGLSLGAINKGKS